MLFSKSNDKTLSEKYIYNSMWYTFLLKKNQTYICIEKVVKNTYYNVNSGHLWVKG